MGDIKIVNIGGINFHNTDLKSTSNDKPVYQAELVTVKDKNGKISVRKEYSVTFKDGTRIQYQEQPKKNEAWAVKDQIGISFMNIKGATITDTPQDDHYRIYSSSDITVKAKREKPVTYGVVSGGGITYKEVTYNRSTDKDCIEYNSSCKNISVFCSDGELKK